MTQFELEIGKLMAQFASLQQQLDNVSKGMEQTNKQLMRWHQDFDNFTGDIMEKMAPMDTDIQNRPRLLRRCIQSKAGFLRYRPLLGNQGYFHPLQRSRALFDRVRGLQRRAGTGVFQKSSRGLYQRERGAGAAARRA